MGFFKRKPDIGAYTDEQLLKEVGRGDTAAFDLLYERYADKLYRYLFRLLSCDGAKAEDFLQDLFLKVLEASPSFDHRRSAATWLYAIATNMCRNEWRNSGNRQRLMKAFEPWEHQGKTTPESMDERKRNRILNKVMDELDTDDREVLQLRFQQELSIREIAVITGLPEGTVKSRVFYLLKKMAKQLNANSIEL